MSLRLFCLAIFIAASLVAGQLWLDSGKEVSQVTPGSNPIPDGEEVLTANSKVANAQGRVIILHNNPISHNPTWDELIGFLMIDQTDRVPYVEGNFTCGDYAEMLHNKAELSQIRAGLVVIELGNTNSKLPNHALNVFDVVDRGLVYIDVTGTDVGAYADKQVVLVAGGYKPVGLFPELGQTVGWESMGTIEKIVTIQW